MASFSEITVRYAETDCMGVVHHAVYPIWFEVARTDYIKAVGMSYSEMEQRGIMLPVIEITCRYRLPAKYDDTLVVKAEVSRLTQAKIEFCYTVTKKGSEEVLCTGTSSHGFVDAKSFRPISFKKAMPEMYEKMEREYLSDTAHLEKI